MSCAQEFPRGDEEESFKLLVLPQLYYACEGAGDPSELQAASQAPGTHFSVPLVLHHRPRRTDSIAREKVSSS